MVFFFILISVMPLTRHPFWSEFVGELTTIKYLGAICFFYALTYLPVRRTPVRLFETSQAKWFILLVTLATISFFTKGAPIPFESSPFMAYVSFLLLFFTTLIVVDSLDRLRWVLFVAVGSMALASLYVLREWQKWEFANVRPGWVTGDPNYFTVAALLFLPSSFLLLRSRRTPGEATFIAICTLLTLLAVTAAASRGGFLGLVVSALFLAWRTSRQLKTVALVVIIMLGLSVLSPVSPLDRFLNPSQGDVQSSDMRLILWEASLRAIAEHPFAGIGAGNFRFVVTRYYDDPDGTPAMVAHNTYLETAAELGLPGLGVFLGALISAFVSLERVRRRAAVTGVAFIHDTTVAMQAGLIGYAVSAFFLSAPWPKFLWLLIFLSMCLPALDRAEMRSRRSPQPDRQNAVA